LFAGFLSAFLIELLGRLEQDPLDVIQDVLIYQTQMMRNSSLGPYVPADFSPPEHIVVVNALFYASLGFMVLAAFIAMLIKSWVREFDRGLRAMSIPEQRAKTREFRYLGMERWKLPEMVETLPLLIQISLLLFAIGLVIFLFHISTPSFGITTTITGVGVFFYTMTTSISVVVSSSPFHSPLSRRLGKVYQRMHAHFCPHVEYFLSQAMDATPTTTLGRIRRHIMIFLQETRPYLENDFVEPVSATTADDVQLYIAALALRRIHESAPDSQHSEALHWSVWQIAGSTTLRVPPLFDLPSWIRNKWDDKEYFSRLPPPMLVALVAVSLRSRIKLNFNDTRIIRAALGPVETIKGPWAQVVIAAFDYETSILLQNRGLPMQGDELTRIIPRKGLNSEESMWILNTLSDLRCEQSRAQDPSYLIGICLKILLNYLPKVEWLITSDMSIIEAVVTFAAISCSPKFVNRQNIVTTSHEHPWLLPNTRNPALFANWFEHTPSVCHKPLISVLFLVVHSLLQRQSYPLADQYFAIITAKGDFPLYTSALTAVGPAIGNYGLFAIGRLLVAQTQELTSETIHPTSIADYTVLGELLKTYNRHLGASENPDPNLFAILLVLSRGLVEWEVMRLDELNLELKDPCSRLVARVIAGLDIPDGSGLSIELFSDHRVQNMIAAHSLLRYRRRPVTQYTESLLLASFLQSRELAIYSAAVEYYMETAISSADPSAPSSYLSHGVHSVFNLMLPDRQLRMGWRVLRTFANGFDKLPMEWRRRFAESFFTLSRQLGPQSQGDTQTNSSERELDDILTWEYFHEAEQEPEFTDSEFSGLDWMAMAWSLHLWQQSDREGRLWYLVAPGVNEEFVLSALCKLLDAAPYYQIIPIIPKLREFIQWFDDTDLPEYRLMISSRVKEVVRRHEEIEAFHRFDKFHCMLYI